MILVASPLVLRVVGRFSRRLAVVGDQARGNTQAALHKVVESRTRCGARRGIPLDGGRDFPEWDEASFIALTRYEAAALTVDVIESQETTSGSGPG